MLRPVSAVPPRRSSGRAASAIQLATLGSIWPRGQRVHRLSARRCDWISSCSPQFGSPAGPGTAESIRPSFGCMNVTLVIRPAVRRPSQLHFDDRSSCLDRDAMAFLDGTPTDRLGRATRGVLRLAGWDIVPFLRLFGRRNGGDKVSRVAPPIDLIKAALHGRGHGPDSDELRRGIGGGMQMSGADAKRIVAGWLDRDAPRKPREQLPRTHAAERGGRGDRRSRTDLFPVVGNNADDAPAGESVLVRSIRWKNWRQDRLIS